MGPRRPGRKMISAQCVPGCTISWHRYRRAASALYFPRGLLRACFFACGMACLLSTQDPRLAVSMRDLAPSMSPNLMRALRLADRPNTRTHRVLPLPECSARPPSSPSSRRQPRTSLGCLVHRHGHPPRECHRSSPPKSTPLSSSCDMVNRSGTRRACSPGGPMCATELEPGSRHPALG